MADEAIVDTPKKRRNGTKKKSLVTKLTEIMSSIDGVEKKGWNDHHKYAYVMEPELFEAVRGGMAERNLMMVPSITSVERHERGIVTVHMLYRILDGDSGESIEIPWSSEGQASDDKGIAKAVTNAKYLIMKLFLIPSFFSNGESTDAENPRTEVQPAKPVVTTAPPASPKPQTGSVISEKQAKRLYAIAKSKDVDVAHFQAYLKENYGYERFTDIERGKYDDIVNLAESGTSFEPAEAQEPELAADDIPF